MKVRKAVILAAGYGTRFLPATRAVPKEMLPIVDRPVIQYIVEEALAAGIEQIIIVSNSGKPSIEDHFRRNAEIERLLESKQNTAILQSILRLAEMPITFAFQEERNGHAVLITKELIGDEPFAIFFPDDLIFHETPAIRQLMDVYDRVGHTVLAVQQVPDGLITQYGIIDPLPVEPRTYEVRRVIEKPALADAPSNLATVGRFVVTPEIFDVLATTPPGRAGEIWLMDAFDLLLNRQTVYAYEYEGTRFDTGHPLGLIEASLYCGLRDGAIGPALRVYLQSLDLA